MLAISKKNHTFKLGGKTHIHMCISTGGKNLRAHTQLHMKSSKNVPALIQLLRNRVLKTCLPSFSLFCLNKAVLPIVKKDG